MNHTTRQKGVQVKMANRIYGYVARHLTAVVAAVCLVGVAPGQADTGMDTVYTKMSGPELQELMQNWGYRAELDVDSVGDPMIRSGVSGTRFTIFFYDCDDSAPKQCESFDFMASFDLDEGIDPALINDWNKRKRFGKGLGRRRDGSVSQHERQRQRRRHRRYVARLDALVGKRLRFLSRIYRLELGRRTIERPARLEIARAISDSLRSSRARGPKTDAEMKRNIVETLIGAVALVVAFACFGYAHPRPDVGSVAALKQGPETIFAPVTLNVPDDIKRDHETNASSRIDLAVNPGRPKAERETAV